MNTLKARKLRLIASDFKNEFITTDDFILSCDIFDILIVVNDKHQKEWVGRLFK